MDMAHCPRIAKRRGPSRSSRGGAFTLIELLVVIAIIGILAALLLPTLSAAKQRSFRSVDLNNLKQLGVSVHLVAGDQNDVMPWPNWFSGEDNTPNPPQGWLYTFNAAASGAAMFDVHTGLFWDQMPMTKSFFCPSDNTNSSLFQARPQQSSSYVMNGAVCGYQVAQNPPVKLAELTPEGVAFWECQNATLDDNIDLFNDGASYPSENTSARHGNVAPCGFFDGSARSMLLTEWASKVSVTTANELWCYPNDPNGGLRLP
jgi:prepilin-type N-terminal cleavage/methylation domain-containing protein/prepilin-type processing-associated H-X9-DG protein